MAKGVDIRTRINMIAWEFTMLALKIVYLSCVSTWMDDCLAIHNVVDILLSSNILCWQTFRISSLLRIGKKTQSMLHLGNKLRVLILS